MTEILSDSEADERLGTGWTRSGAVISREVELASFPQAIEVVDRVAVLAEAADHHPDIDIRWRTLTFRLSTHLAGGLTAKDFALAAEIDSVLSVISVTPGAPLPAVRRLSVTGTLRRETQMTQAIVVGTAAFAAMVAAAGGVLWFTVRNRRHLDG